MDAGKELFGIVNGGDIGENLDEDNCGEIVLDKLFLEQLKKKYPPLEISVMVRGGEVLNDATEEDAMYTGINKLAKIISNGNSIAGTVYEMLPD